MRDFIRGIKNLILFFPYVWRFRAWDYEYTCELFSFSLELLYEDMRTFPYGPPKDKKTLKAFKDAFKRYYENKYYNKVSYKKGKREIKRLLSLANKKRNADYKIIIDNLKHVNSWWT